MRNLPARAAAFLLAIFWMFAIDTSVLAAPKTYGLKPVRVAGDTYVFFGDPRHFSFGNGGNIVNTGFIVTSAGVVVFDTGPSKLYGEEMRKAIARVTDKPVHSVFISHHHPDHFFGNQVFSDVPVYALEGTLAAARLEGDGFSDGLYKLAGDWMRGTESTPPTHVVKPGPLSIGDHEFEIIALSGHTAADMAMLDKTTGVLFAGDLLFNRRAPATAHATLSDWRKSLNALQMRQIEVIVSGHGPIEKTGISISGTRDYLKWLEASLRNALETGLDMTEIMDTKIPARFRNWGAMPGEFHRSVSHLFPKMERRSLPRVDE